MLIRLDDMNLTSWLWHDAEIHFFALHWKRNGEVSLRLRTEINPEEDRSTLIDRGINSSIVDVEFRRVFRVKIDINADYSPREVILDWTEIQDSSMIIRPAQNKLFHHRISCSGGSVFDIVFEQIWIAEAKNDDQ